MVSWVRWVSKLCIPVKQPAKFEITATDAGNSNGIQFTESYKRRVYC